MKYKYFYKRIISQSKYGFVLPYTLFICSIMILITTSVSTMLIKQLYFSKLSRQSQAAYYAADNAVLCAAMIDETYVGLDGIGIFPYDAGSGNYDFPRIDMEEKLSETNGNRGVNGYSPLATTLDGVTDGIRCGQALIFAPAPAYSDFKVSTTTFEHTLLDGVTIEQGRTSSFNMKMDLGDGTSRCAKVTVNKTASYRQIIAQGYALCDRPDGSVERAVVNTTILQ